MKFVEHKLATGAMLTGYLRDETTEMPSYNTRPAVLILLPARSGPCCRPVFAGRLPCVHPDLFHRPRPAAVAAADRSRVRHPVPAPECGGPAHCSG